MFNLYLFNLSKPKAFEVGVFEKYIESFVTHCILSIPKDLIKLNRMDDY